MSWFSCKFLGCGGSDITPYDQFDKEASDIINSACDSDGKIYIDKWVQTLADKGVNQTNAEDIFSELLSPNMFSVSKTIASSYFSRLENSSKLKKLLVEGKFLLDSVRKKEADMSIECRVIINQSDEKGIIYEKRFISLLEKDGLDRDRAEAIWKCIPGSTRYHYVSKTSAILYFSLKDNEQWLLTQLNNAKNQQEQQHFQAQNRRSRAQSSAVYPSGVALARAPSINRLPSLSRQMSRARFGNPLEAKAESARTQLYLKDQLFRTLQTDGVITREGWGNFPWNAADCALESAMQMFDGIQKVDPKFISKEEFDNYFVQNADRIGPLLLKGYKAAQRILLTRLNSNPTITPTEESKPPEAPAGDTNPEADTSFKVETA